MRTVPFRNIWNRVLRLRGLDANRQHSADLRATLTDHINERVNTIWKAWRWPEWELTEERAFRPVWSSTEPYLKISLTDGHPDEVFYLGASFVTGEDFGTGYGYYRVKTAAILDPPIGTVPTNTNYWEAIEPVDTFIPYNQRDRRVIGEVLAVNSQNPRVPTGSNLGVMNFEPSARGIDVPSGGSTVFITHKLPCPIYTMTPYVIGRVYDVGDRVFHANNNECYQAIHVTTNVPFDETVNDHWIWIPFLAQWENYVVNGAFADSLMEVNPDSDADIQSRMVLFQTAEQKANDALQSEVDALAVQGQRLTYDFCRNSRQSNMETVTLIPTE